MRGFELTRRALVGAAGLGALGALTRPAIATSGSAGKLAIALWAHPIPAANAALAAVCREWAEQARVELRLDFMASTRTAAAEAHAGVGHDIVAHPTFQLALNRRLLEPLDEVM